MSNINSSNDSLDFVIHLFHSEIPKEKSKLIEKIKKYGVLFTSYDKLFFEDIEGDKIEIQEEILELYLKMMGESIIKIIIKKFWIDDIINLDYTDADYLMNNKFTLNENIEIINNQLSNKNSDFLLNNSLNNISFSESLIFNNHDTCFMLLTKKYFNEIHHLLIHSYFEDEKNMQNFKNFLINFSNSININTDLVNFSDEEIRIANENIIHIHTVVCHIFDKYFERKRSFNHFIAEINEKLKTEIILSQENRRNLKKFMDKFEKNKGIFNRFLIELNDHIADFDFYLKNDNFEPEKFENNLSSLFSFMISLIFDFNSRLLDKFPFKTDKYNKLINDFMNKKYTLNDNYEINEFEENDNPGFHYYHLQKNEKLKDRKRETIEIDYIMDSNLYDV